MCRNLQKCRWVIRGTPLRRRQQVDKWRIRRCCCTNLNLHPCFQLSVYVANINCSSDSTIILVISSTGLCVIKLRATAVNLCNQNESAYFISRFPFCSLQMMTPSACTLRSQRQPVLMPSHSSPKWTLAKVTENKYHSIAIAETRGFQNEVPEMRPLM